MKTKILLAVDCFDQSLNVVRYCSKVFLPEKHEIVLFHVELLAPEKFMDISPNGLLDMAEIPVDGWIKKNRTNTDIFLKQAKSIFIQSGFNSDSVTIIWNKRKKGVARDIIEESKKNYALLVIGRSETHAKNDTTIGSVTNKLLFHCNHIPLSIVGGNPSTTKMLVGFDHSTGSNRTIDFLCKAFQNKKMNITLCHIIRSLKMNKSDKENKENYFHHIFDETHEIKWQMLNKDNIKPATDRAMKKLKNCGWLPHQLHINIVLDVETRSQSLVNEAHKAECGTIVVGRHGSSMIKEFFLGRVVHKIINKAHDHAVWIIS